MEGFIVSILVGIVCIILGIFNMKGNISSIHSYHRQRVSEEDKIPYGKMVGLGTIIIGCVITVFGILSIITAVTGIEIFTLIGTVIMIAGIVVGLILSFRAMIKYNKGIF